LARDHDLLLHIHAGAGRLLAVAQRGIENLHYVILVIYFRQLIHLRFSLYRYPLVRPEMKTPAAWPTGVCFAFI